MELYTDIQLHQCNYTDTVVTNNYTAEGAIHNYFQKDFLEFVFTYILKVCNDCK